MSHYFEQKELSFEILKEISAVCQGEPDRGYIILTFYGDMSNHYSFGRRVNLHSSNGEQKDFKLNKEHPLLKAFIALREGLAKKGDFNSGFSQVSISYKNSEAKFQFNYGEPSPLWPPDLNEWAINKINNT